MSALENRVVVVFIVHYFSLMTLERKKSDKSDLNKHLSNYINY